MQTLKATTLTDVESLFVLDMHISARWKHDTKTGPQVVRIPAEDLLSVAADKAFHNWITKYEFYALGIDPLILQRGSSPSEDEQRQYRRDFMRDRLAVAFGDE